MEPYRQSFINWELNLNEVKKIDGSQDLVIYFQGRKFTVNGFMIESVIGFGPIAVVPKKVEN